MFNVQFISLATISQIELSVQSQQLSKTNLIVKLECQDNCWPFKQKILIIVITIDGEQVKFSSAKEKFFLMKCISSNTQMYFSLMH